MNSSQLDSISVKTSENVTLGYSIAGLGSRLVAQILDNLIALPVTLIAILLYGAVASVFVTSAEGTGFADAGAGFFAGFVYFGYFFVAEVVTGGKTLGKSAMGTPGHPGRRVRSRLRRSGGAQRASHSRRGSRSDRDCHHVLPAADTPSR